jgi:hypothetical protein
MTNIESIKAKSKASSPKPISRLRKRSVVEARASTSALALRVQSGGFLLRDSLRRSLRLAALLVSRRRLLALENVLLVLKVSTAAGLRRRVTSIIRQSSIVDRHSRIAHRAPARVVHRGDGSLASRAPLGVTLFWDLSMDSSTRRARASSSRSRAPLGCDRKTSRPF